MKKVYKYRAKVSDTVEQKLSNTLDICRELYNAGLQERRDAYKLQRKSISYQDQAQQLPAIKESRADVKAVHSQVLQDVLKRVEKAMKGFFGRVKKREKAGYPRFKTKSRYDSLTYLNDTLRKCKRDGNSFSKTHHSAFPVFYKLYKLL